MLQLTLIARIPEPGLVNAIATLTHVDRLQIAIQMRQLLAPGVVVINAKTQREGVTRADHSLHAIRDLLVEIPGTAIALPIDG